jgi:chaperonin GroEL (HSP60 family)
VQDLETDEELANVATVSAGNNADIGDMISLAMQKVGRQGVVTMEESRTAEDHLNVVEGMQVRCHSFARFVNTFTHLEKQPAVVHVVYGHSDAPVPALHLQFAK